METASTWEEDLIQRQEVPTEMLCSSESSSAVSEQYMAHEGLSCPAPEQLIPCFQNPLLFRAWSGEQGREPMPYPETPRMSSNLQI